MHRWWFFLIAGCYWAGSSSQQVSPDVPPEPSMLPPDPSLPRLRRLSVREIVNAYVDLFIAKLATKLAQTPESDGTLVS